MRTEYMQLTLTCKVYSTRNVTVIDPTVSVYGRIGLLIFYFEMSGCEK